MSPKPFSLIYLEKENDLNKILKVQKRSGEHMRILYTSPWDKACQKLLKKLGKVYPSTSLEGPNERIYIANSFTMPHSFVIFKTTKVPHLITLGKNFVRSEDYLPFVYQALRVP